MNVYAVVLSELFQEQYSRQGDIARDHLAIVFSIVDEFISVAVGEVRHNVTEHSFS